MNIAIALLALLVSQTTFAASPTGEQSLELACHQSQVSHGLEVAVVSGGVFPDVKIALVRKKDRSGVRDIEAILLKKTSFGTHDVYSGAGLQLQVQRESRVPNSFQPGKLEYQNDSLDMACQVEFEE